MFILGRCGWRVGPCGDVCVDTFGRVVGGDERAKGLALLATEDVVHLDAGDLLQDSHHNIQAGAVGADADTGRRLRS
eukprot:6634262-Alexandrium_andersonii.AAC.1